MLRGACDPGYAAWLSGWREVGSLGNTIAFLWDLWLAKAFPVAKSLRLGEIRHVLVGTLGMTKRRFAECLLLSVYMSARVCLLLLLHMTVSTELRACMPDNIWE